MHTVKNDARKYDISVLQETKLSAQSTGRIQLKWGHLDGFYVIGIRRYKKGRGNII